jgi:hypothetical protein
MSAFGQLAKFFHIPIFALAKFIKNMFLFWTNNPLPPPPKKNKQKKQTKTKNKQTKHVKTGVRCSMARLVSSEMSGNPNNYNSIKQTQMFAIVNWNWCYANNKN